MSTKRIPISRPVRSLIPPEAVDVFGEMKTLKCTCRPIDWEGKYWERDECPECQRWWSLHSRLADLLPGLKPWDWPLIENPRAKCPYPVGSPAAAAWKPNEEAQARWRALDAALAEAEQAKAIFTTSKKPRVNRHEKAVRSKS